MTDIKLYLLMYDCSFLMYKMPYIVLLTGMLHRILIGNEPLPHFMQAFVSFRVLNPCIYFIPGILYESCFFLNKHMLKVLKEKLLLFAVS